MFALFALPSLHAAAGGVAVLAGVVAVKLVVEWSAFRATHGDDGSAGGRLTGWLSGPSESAADPVPIEVPDAEPDAEIPVHRRTAVATAVLRTLTGVAPAYATGFFIVWIAAFGLFVGDVSGTVVVWSAVVVGSLSLAALAVNVAGFALAHAPVEYRRYGGRVVAYDAWLDEPQWTAAVDRLRNASVVHTRFPDRVFGARTVELTAGVGDAETARVLGPVADGEALVSALDLPVRSTDLPPMDRRIAAVAVAVGIAVAVSAAALIAGPWGGPGTTVRVILLLPFSVWPTRFLWRQAYVDPE